MKGGARHGRGGFKAGESRTSNRGVARGARHRRCSGAGEVTRGQKECPRRTKARRVSRAKSLELR
jgi:hypothetical protein